MRAMAKTTLNDWCVLTRRPRNLNRMPEVSTILPLAPAAVGTAALRKITSQDPTSLGTNLGANLTGSFFAANLILLGAKRGSVGGRQFVR
jgi:hypothetical protein